MIAPPATITKKLRLLLVAAVLAAGVAVLGARGENNMPNPVRASRFGVFDSSQYSNVDLEQLGLMRSGTIEETPAQAAAIRSGSVPDKAAFQRAVAAQAGLPGPVVLDYEDLYLNGSAGLIAFRARVITILTRWAREAAPGKVIGFYGLLDHTSPRSLAALRRLTRQQGAFFPSLYLRHENRHQWSARLVRDVTLARAIDNAKPVYPYLWPQHASPGSAGGSYLSASEWAFELAKVRRYANGMVIWSKKTSNHADGWVRVTHQFMRRLRGESRRPAGG